MDLKGLDDVSLKVLWAAMVAMVDDNHSPQDNLSDEHWTSAEQTLKLLDAEVNARFGKKNV